MMANNVCSLTTLFTFFIHISFKAASSQIHFGDKCNSPDEYLGTCVELQRCENLLALRFKTPQNHFDRLYASLSYCGISQNNQPMVCCTQSPFPQKSVSETKPQSIGDPPKVPSIGHSDCAVSLNNRIFGGRETEINEMPFTVLLKYSKSGVISGKSSGYFCGGALISRNSIVTAAHCVDERVLTRKGWQLRGARLGEWNLETDPDCNDENICAPSVRDIFIDQVIIHGEFIPLNENQNYDIAILKLRIAVEFNDFVKPICLPQNSLQQFDGVPLIVAGFGRTESSDNSLIKLKTSVRGISNDKCQKLYSTDHKEIRPEQMCALGELGKDSCNGDSGQPLLHVNSQTSPARLELVGIVSYGPSPCGQKNKPGVYTRIEPFLQWIRQNMS